MPVKNLYIAFVLSFLSIATTNTHAAVNFVNGSFEEPAIPNLYWAYPSSLPGWSSSTGFGTLNIHGNSLWPAQDGQQHIEFDQRGSTLSQTLSNLTIGTEYTVTFALAANPDLQATFGLSLNILDGSNVINSGNFTASSVGYSHQNIGWTDRTLNFVASRDVLTFQFQRTDANSNGYGPELDNVRLTEAVPEPETYAMLLAGLGLVSAVSIRRKA